MELYAQLDDQLTRVVVDGQENNHHRDLADRYAHSNCVVISMATALLLCDL